MIRQDRKMMMDGNRPTTTESVVQIIGVTAVLPGADAQRLGTCASLVSAAGRLPSINPRTLARPR